MKRSFGVRLSLFLFVALGTGLAAVQSSRPAQAPAAASAQEQKTASNSSAPFKDEKEKVSYALGVFLAARVKSDASEFDPNVVAQALKEAMAGGKMQMTEQEALTTLSQWQKDVQARRGAEGKKEGDAFLAANAKKEGVTVLPSGLQYKILKQGTGPKPTAADTVVCNYRGTLVDGSEFDSSYKRGQPASFPVNQVIKGWTEALQMMPVGSKWQLFVPSDLAYGESGRPGIPPNATLIFEVELISIQGK